MVLRSGINVHKLGHWCAVLQKKHSPYRKYHHSNDRSFSVSDTWCRREAGISDDTQQWQPYRGKWYTIHALLKLNIELLTISREGKDGSGITYFIYGDIIVTSSIVRFIRYQGFTARLIFVSSLGWRNVSDVVSVADEWRWQWGTIIAENLIFFRVFSG